MRFVIASAFQRALASLVLCVGLLWVVFIGLASSVLTASSCRPGAGMSCAEVPVYRLSSRDIAIAIGIAAASVLVAALIHPKRP